MLKVRCQASATVDAKGRLSLPAPLRKALDVHRVHSLILCHFRGAIWAWTPEDYERTVEGPLSEREGLDEEVLDFVHAWFTVVDEVTIDRSGRINLPPELRELAGIGKDVRVFSVLDRIEIWDEAAWKARFLEARERAPSFSALKRPSAPEAA